MRDTLRLFRFLKPYRHWAVLAPLLMVLEVAMDLLQPRLVERIVDDGIAKGAMSVVLSTGAWQVGAAIAGLLFGMGCAVFAILAGQSFGADLRAALFAKVQTLSFGNLDRLETGALVTRLTNDVTQVTELHSRGRPNSGHRPWRDRRARHARAFASGGQLLRSAVCEPVPARSGTHVACICRVLTSHFR